MSLGMQEILIILVVVLVIFGAGRVPEVMRNLGQSVREIKEITEGEDEVSQ